MARDFGETVLPHLDSAYALARWLMRDGTAAEDVVGDALLRAMRYFPSHHGERTRAWLLTIVRRVAYDAMRARAGEIGIDAIGEREDPGDDPEAAAMRAEHAGIVDRAIAALAPELRECLVLRELEDMSYRDIAHVVGVPVGTVMSRLWRARQELRAMGERL